MRGLSFPAFLPTRLHHLVAGFLLALASLLALWPAGVLAKSERTPTQQELNALPTIALADLPGNGRKIYALILQGGPFRFDKDGSIFGNRERILPKAARGYYREYTVPGGFLGRSRGAKRIVCGGYQAKQPDACYYSPDHYASFSRIVAAQDAGK